MELVSEIQAQLIPDGGSALYDFGRGAVKDISKTSGSAPQAVENDVLFLSIISEF